MPETITRGRHPADPNGTSMGDQHWPLPTQYEGLPPMYVAFDREQLTVIGVGEYKTLWSKATKQNSPDVITIGPRESRTTYSVFTEMELKILYRNITGQEHPSQDFVTLSKDVQEQVMAVEPLPVPDKLLRYPPRPVTTHVTDKRTPDKPWNRPEVKQTPPPPTVTPNKEVNRPKAGTATGRVWDIADKVYEQYPDVPVKELRQRIIAACVDKGINASTAQTQYSRWRGSKNIA